MKKIILYAVCMFTLLLSFTQCEKDKGGGRSAEQTAFLAKTTYCVFNGTSELLTYSEASGQYVMGVSVKSVRVQTDDASKYFSITFPVEPAKDVDVSAEIAVKGLSGLTDGKSTVTLKVLEMKDNMLWLWDNTAKIGYLAPWGI